MENKPPSPCPCHFRHFFMDQNLARKLFSPTRLACGVLTSTKGCRLGLAERAVPQSCRDRFTQRSWYQDPGTKILVPSSWYQDPGTKILVPSMLREKVKPITTPPDKVFERPDNRSKVSVKISQIGFAHMNFSRSIFPYMSNIYENGWMRRFVF